MVFVLFVAEDDAAALLTAYFGAFRDRCKESVRIGFTYAARHRPAFGEGIADPVADHAVLSGTVGPGEEPCEHLKAIAAVEVVGVYHGERFAYRSGGRQYGVSRTPRLYSVGGRNESVRQRIYRLEYHFGRNASFVLGEYLFAEIPFEVAAYDEDHLSESCPRGIEDRVVHDGFARRAHPVELFEAAVPGTHAGRHYQ